MTWNRFGINERVLVAMKSEDEVKLENIERNFDLFKLYLLRTEEFIDEATTNLELTLKKHENGEWAHVSFLEAITNNINPPEESIKAELELESVELFPFLLRESFFVMIYGSLEAFLMSECMSKGKGKPRNGNKMERAKECLVDSGSLYVFEDSKEWKEIKKYQKLRNCFTHDNGVLESKDNDLNRFIDETEKLFLIDNQIAIKAGFCEEVVTTIERFLTDLVLLGYKKI